MSGVDAVLIEGDGSGPEIMAEAVKVLDATGVRFAWEEHAAGLGAYDRTGHTAPATTLAAIRKLGVALKGPFDTPSGGTIKSANHYIRRELDLYACVRPVEIDGAEVLLVRENVEDLYAAVEWWSTPDVANAVKIASRAGCRRIAEFAFRLAERTGRSRVTLVHKANNLKLTEGLLLDETRAAAAAHPRIELDDMLSDTAASTMILDPSHFQVVVANNTFGDILSNVLAAVAGSLGLVPSANLGHDIVVTEPSHGSAPQLAGTGRANPLAAIRAGAMLLDAIDRGSDADRVRASTRDAIAAGVTTPDLGGSATTSEVGDEIAARVRATSS